MKHAGTSDKEFILLFRRLVEEKWMLGQDGKLKQRDFEYLSQLIEEKSNVRLSLSTLKRLWRDDFSQAPHPSTLDALASALDHGSWQEFKKAFADKGVVSSKATRARVPASVYVIAGFVLAMAGFFALQAFNNEDRRVPVKIPFTADKQVVVGVPNTVTFNYDFRNVDANQFYIQPSTNPAHKKAVNPNDHYFPATYYEPGFHWARLMADDSIVTFASVHIKTDGWLPLAKYNLNDKPIYLPFAQPQGVLTVTSEALKEAGVADNKNYYVQFFNIRDFENVHSDDFELETRIKSTVSDTRALAEVSIVTEEDVFVVPLAGEQNAARLTLKIGEQEIHQQDSLAGFKTSLADWQHLKIKTENRRAQIFVNGELVREVAFEKNFGAVKGLVYTFAGSGEVDYVTLKNKNSEVVYEDQFN